MKKSILISGGTGLVGQRLTSMAEEAGFEVRILTRNQKRIDGKKYFHWDIKNKDIDVDAFKNISAFIHLAGAGIVDKKWTTERKKEILESRTETLRWIHTLQSEQKINIPHIISASGIGIYGFHPTIEFNEHSPHQAGGFAQEVCYEWEKVVAPFKSDTLWNIIRIGIVLSKNGGALKEMKKGVLPVGYSYFGNGKQWVSWIHIDDLCRLFLSCITNSSFQNKTLNAVSPNPAMNKDLLLTLAKTLHYLTIGFPAPSFVLKTMLGDRSELILKGTKVSSEEIERLGFKFSFPDLEGALKEIYN